MKKRIKNKNIKKDNRKVGKWLYWTPRILTIIFILFLAMFSLDIFDGNYGFWGTILGLFMHNIPVLILLVILIIAWRHEWIGAIGFILGGVLYIALLFVNPFQWYMIAWSLQIAGPAIVIGVLWWLNWKRRK